MSYDFRTKLRESTKDTVSECVGDYPRKYSIWQSRLFWFMSPGAEGLKERDWGLKIVKYVVFALRLLFLLNFEGVETVRNYKQ